MAQAEGLAALDEVYRVPLAEFIAARDALAARLKTAGDKAGAEEVKRARKPSVPAWAANQVVWQDPDAWRRLQAAVAALRSAHERAPSADELLDARRKQREALQACEARAGELLRAHGHAASPSVVAAVGGSLLALAHGADGVLPGRLEHELQPPGFEVLAGLALAPSRPTAPAVAPLPADVHQKATAEQEAREEDRRASLAAAEGRQAAAKRELDDAREALLAAEVRRDALAAELAAARVAWDAARRRVDEAEEQARAADEQLSALLAGSADG